MKPLIQALARASLNFTGIKKEGQALAGGTRPYSYMTLDDILATVRPALATESLFLWHDPRIVENRFLEVHCHVSDGEYTLSNCVTLPIAFSEKGNQAQAMGSLLTYGKRYSVCALLGINADIDDDAQATAQAEPAAKPVIAAAPAGPSRIAAVAPIVPVTRYEPAPEAMIDQTELHRLEMWEKLKDLLSANKVTSGVILEKTGMPATMLERAPLNDLVKFYKVFQQMQTATQPQQ